MKIAILLWSIVLFSSCKSNKSNEPVFSNAESTLNKQVVELKGKKCQKWIELIDEEDQISKLKVILL
jgi:hypothetical protein